MASLRTERLGMARRPPTAIMAPIRRHLRMAETRTTPLIITPRLPTALPVDTTAASAPLAGDGVPRERPRRAWRSVRLLVRPLGRQWPTPTTMQPRRTLTTL